MLNDGKIFDGKKQQKNSVKDWFFDVYKETPSVTQSQEAVLEASTTKLQKVRSAILEEQPVISGKRQSALYFFLAFLIFFGEFYLVYTFLADILGFSLTGDNEFSLKKEWPRVLFSIIYPIGIGMFFEIAFTKANRAGQLRKTVYRTGFWVMLVAIFLISILNAINLTEKTNNYRLADYFNNSDFFTAMSGLALIVFLASITLLLAITGASVLHEAIKMSRRHFHLNGGLLKKLEKNGHYQSILRQMERQKEKLVDLEKQKKTLLSELAAAESNSKLYERTIDLLKSKESFKNTAKFLYLSGYEEGRSLKLSRMPEDEFLIYSYKINFNKPDYPEN